MIYNTARNTSVVDIAFGQNDTVPEIRFETDDVSPQQSCTTIVIVIIVIFYCITIRITTVLLYTGGENAISLVYVIIVCTFIGTAHAGVFFSARPGQVKFTKTGFAVGIY